MSKPDEALDLVGRPIPESAKRDAVHIALAPVVAGEDLNPGDWVAFAAGGHTTVFRHGHRYVGIVDPYVVGPIPKGTRVYLFLTPGSITSLVHRWQHPAFPD